MQIIPIKFNIHLQDLGTATPEDLEQSIKNEIMSNIHDAIQPMLDNENFITMVPDEKMDQVFNVELNIILGSASEYIDATSLTTTNLLNLCMEQEVEREDAIEIISDATRPLIDLVK